MPWFAPRALALAALVSTFLLNLQGTFLRATGSGDGCGTSWPTCHGEVIPLDPGFATALEFTHRVLTVGVGVIGLLLLVQAFRHRRRHPGLLPIVAVAALFFVAQSLVGAFTVVAGLTGGSTDPLRAVILPLHLINSFTQLAALALAVAYAGPRPPGRLQVRGRWRLVGVIALATAAFYALVFTGGIAALGNTFAPVDTLAEGIRAEFAPDAHWVVRIRVVHPALAAALGTLLLLAAPMIAALRRDPAVTRVARWLGGAYLLQLGLGTWNWLALAPLPLSLTHQALAMVTFVLFALLVATALGRGAALAPPSDAADPGRPVRLPGCHPGREVDA